MPSPGDRHPGFIVEPMRCWAMVYSKQLQAAHCRETPSWTERWFSPKGDRWWRVWSCPDHLEGLTVLREFGPRRPAEMPTPPFRQLTAALPQVRGMPLRTGIWRSRNVRPPTAQAREWVVGIQPEQSAGARRLRRVFHHVSTTLRTAFRQRSS